MSAANDQDSMWVRRIPNNQAEADEVVEILKNCDFDYEVEWTALKLGKDENGAIEGSIEMRQIFCPNFDEQGYLKCEVNVAYAASERTDYCTLSMRLWAESNPAQSDTHRIGWELVGLADKTALDGPTTGYLPDLPKLVHIPADNYQGTKYAGYKFTRFETDLLRLYSNSKRERIRRMSPDARKAAMTTIFWLDDDSMIELGRTSEKPLTGADIQAGMIVRRACNEYRIIVGVDDFDPGVNGKVGCAYVEYKPNCAWNAINPKLKRGYPDASICTTDEMATWAQKVVSWNWDDKVWHEDWKALKKRQKEGGEANEPV